MANQGRLERQYAEAQAKADALKKQCRADARETKRREKAEERIMMLQIRNALGDGFLNALEHREITIDWVYLADNVIRAIEEHNQNLILSKRKCTLKGEAAERWTEIRKRWEARILEAAKSK